MKLNYLPHPKTLKRWSTEFRCQPTEYLRNKYYAYLKHRAQARHRGEPYSLTWDDWHSLWSTRDWENRGRKSTNTVLGRLNWREGWHLHNVRVMTRREHFNLKAKQNVK